MKSTWNSTYTRARKRMVVRTPKERKVFNAWRRLLEADGDWNGIVEWNGARSDMYCAADEHGELICEAINVRLNSTAVAFWDEALDDIVAMWDEKHDAGMPALEILTA